MRRLHADVANKVNGMHQGQSVESLEDHCGVTAQIGELEASGDDHKALIVVGEYAQESFDTGIFQTTDCTTISSPSSSGRVL
jgi:hypothetical protein